MLTMLRSVSIVMVAAIVVTLAVTARVNAATTSERPPTLAGQAAATATTTVYLPNITRMLGGPDGWQTPFIVQNVGTVATDLTMSFYAFSDGTLVKTRVVTALQPGTSVFHDPNSDTELAAGGQFSVVVASTTSPIVAVVNEHQNVSNPTRQEALSYSGLSSGSTSVSLPYVADQVSGWLTTFIMQNLGSATANVTAKFVTGTTTVTLLRTIAPGRSGFVDPRFESQLAVGSEYGVTLTSDQPIAVVVNAHNDAASAVFPKGFSYNGVPASSLRDQFVPYVARNADTVRRSSRLLVQNSGLAAAVPHLFFRKFDTATPIGIDLPSLQPGATASFDPTTAGQLADGEYSLHVTGGQFAVVDALTTQTSAMGYVSQSAFTDTIYLPNITRTLGGPNGWTTPFIVQATSQFQQPITIKWFRFADGQLVTTQTLVGLPYGASHRVDPRAVTALTDDTQYAVVVNIPIGGQAVVTELNLSGGDGEMAYEGFAPPATPLAAGASACTPATGPAGTPFNCTFTGLPAGAAATFTLSAAGGSGTPVNTAPTAADGTWTGVFVLTATGQRTVTITAAGVTKFAQVNVTPATFTVQITQAGNGSITAKTSPNINCIAFVVLSDGTFSQATGLAGVVKTSDASGIVTWTYTPDSKPVGQARQEVICASGGTEAFDARSISIP